jgi:subtilisin-like proprotein convertase family protein
MSALRLFRLATLLAAVAVAPAWAAVPGTSLIEGSLTSTGGGPAADGNYQLTFNLYKDAQAAAPYWSEGPVAVAVKNGAFAWQLGSTAPIDVAALGEGAWLSVKVANDPELPRKPVNSSLFALRAAVADSIDPGLLANFPKKTDLAGVALSGNYADLSGAPNLSTYAKIANLAAVATTGSYSDLSNKPVLAQVGKSCGTGLVVNGIAADGSLSCVAGGAGSLPNDGIGQVSNGLINVIFTDGYTNAKALDIPDNNPIGVADTVVVPDNGLAQKLTVTVKLTNSDLAFVKIFLYDPNNTEYVLCGAGQLTGNGWSQPCGEAPDGLDATWPEPTKTLTGDLTTWVGKNPKGNWIIKVVDSKFLNNGVDGQVQSWSVNVQTLSNKKAQVKGDLIVDGNVVVGGKNIKDLLPTPWPTIRYRVFSTYDQACCWMNDNKAENFLGVNPSSWGDGNAVAWSISPNKDLWRNFFTHEMKVFPNLNVWAESWRNYSSTNSKHIAVLMRIKNSTQNDINWAPAFYFTAYNDWGNRSSITVNGAASWQYSGNCYSNNSANPTFSIPKNRTSSVIFIIGNSPQSGDLMTNALIFYNNSLNLPKGLSFVDDLDTAESGWDK